MWNKHIETFIGCDCDFTAGKTVLFGAPFDSTTSNRPGARFAPSAMRKESWGLETYSPYQDKGLSDCFVFDGGDIELPFGSPEPALAMLEEKTEEILTAGKRPFLIGGEHLVSLAAIKAAAKKYPDLHVIHFDAHADLRDDYLGQSLSHATVMRRVWDILGDGKIFQFGIRSGDREEFLWAKQHVQMQKFNFTGLEQVVKTLAGKPVYLSIDLDVLDPSVFPGTGTPEAGGVSFVKLLNAALHVLKHSDVVACDLVELAPNYDPSGVSTATACKLMREMLIALT